MKNKRNKSMIKTILLSILSLAFSLLLLAGLIWKNEIRTVASIKEIMPGNDEGKPARLIINDEIGDQCGLVIQQGLDID